jgi:hypothetical protein
LDKQFALASLIHIDYLLVRKCDGVVKMNTLLAINNTVLEPNKNERPTAYAERLGRWYASLASMEHKKQFGQYFTYFRVVNGNTQVSATELRAMPLPPLKLIVEIGRRARTALDRKVKTLSAESLN